MSSVDLFLSERDGVEGVSPPEGSASVRPDRGVHCRKAIAPAAGSQGSIVWSACLETTSINDGYQAKALWNGPLAWKGSHLVGAIRQVVGEGDTQRLGKAQGCAQ